MNPVKILIVENENIVAWDIQNILEGLGYTVTAIASSGAEAIQQVAATNPDLVLMDIRLQGEMDGVEASEEIHTRFNIPVVYLTAHADETTLKRAKTTEPFGYLIKPFQEKELNATIEIALSKYKQQNSLKKEKQWFATILESIGDSVIVTNNRGLVTFMNPLAEALTGWKKEDAFGKDVNQVLQLVHTESREVIEHPITNAIENGAIVRLADRWLLRTKNGTEKFIGDSAAPIRDEEGNIMGVVAVFQDISDRKAAELALQESEARLRLALEAAHMGTWHWDILTNSIMYSDQLGPVFGLPPGSYHPTYEAFLDAVHPEDREYVAQAVARTIGEGADYGIEFRVIWPDGTLHWVGNKGQVYRDETGCSVRLVGVAMDITERKQVEETLRMQVLRERLMGAIAQRIRQSLHLEEILNTTVAQVREFLQTDRVLIYRFEPDWSGVVVVESVDDRWISMLGRRLLDPDFATTFVSLYQHGRIQTTDDIYAAGLTPCHIDLLAQFQVRANLVVPILQGEQLWGLLIAHHCSGPRQWQQFNVDLLQQLATQVAIAIQQSELYQQLEAANQQLQRLASVDGLTQIANRRCFDESFDKEWRRMAREEIPLSLIMSDIDFFKNYNDTYGHQAGDECLRQVASAINRVLKRPADLVARYGGEEFAIILPNTTAEGAFQVAETIRLEVKALKIRHINSPISEYVTLSLGIATAQPWQDGSSETLIAAADQALYQAKAEGRDRVLCRG
ncbi:diguanylate cyclase domain-containing protein [Coleofasciculus sp. H7-2]|uniref:diguanylate cyclase domain-containing protein n=1 Tax=Coleofasciculus sp. H7-2 TaxID=3351545 RepID=UPI0036722B35